MTRSSDQLVEHFFRHESANLVAALTRAYGMRRLDLVEDMVQVAMLEAMQAWKHRGVPENPAAWLHRTAKHRIVDALRREKSYQKALAASEQQCLEHESTLDDSFDSEHLSDSLLRMMFVCCHPSLDRKTQIALTLKTLCGFGISEIARGLLMAGEAVKKRIQRGKRTLSIANIQLDLPSEDDLCQRLEVVHDVLYLLFNEGYSTSRTASPISHDLCEEAARLCYLLSKSRYASPDTHALLALFLFHSARFDSRLDFNGASVLLEHQDRTKWDQALICHAKTFLAKSRDGTPSKFHIEAAIAMHHCMSADVKSTDWESIIELYSRLLQLKWSPIYVLNRAIALAQLGMIEKSLDELHHLRQQNQLTDYLLLDCAFARIHELSGQNEDAVDSYLRARAKAKAPHELELIDRKLSAITQKEPKD